MSVSRRIYSAASNRNEAEATGMKDATTSTSRGRIATAGMETEIENYESKSTQRRHYSEADEDVTTYENADDAEGHWRWRDDANGEEIKSAAAGIETNIENYENIRTQRQHFSEEDACEVTDVTTEENTAEVEAAIDMAKETAKTEEAARVEKQIVEDCEGVRTQRKHFPGTTTSHIFR